jgi:HK97 family phage prohead protease
MPLQFSHLRHRDHDDNRERLNNRIHGLLAQEQRAAAAFATIPGLQFRPPGGEVRAVNRGGKKILAGYACVWNALADLGSDLLERLVRGCFGKSMTSGQVACLFSHNSGSVLCSQRSNSLDLEEDSTGLRFEARLNDTHAADDCYENVQRGEINGMSFGFVCKRDRWDTIDMDPDDDDNENYSRRTVQCRTVLEAELLEISPTYWPAYEATSVTAAERALTIWPNGMPKEIRSRFGVVPAGMPISQAEEEFRLRMRLIGTMLVD